MREIIFRGKRVGNGGWVYGYYVYTHERHRIIHEDHEGFYCEDEVVHETVGQYTGLKDKNGKMIFEGDIFTSDYFDDTYNFEVVFNNGAFCGKHEKTGIFMLGFNNYDDNGEELGYWCEEDYTSHIQIIGNIHDQKEDV